MMSCKQECLVSILLISYNASRYIVDALESIKNQTYKRIEVIIADDASNDDTVAIAEKWFEGNENTFVRYEICKSEKNRGTTRNLNEGLRHCQGEFIKPLAADDLLLPNCVEDSLEYCLKYNLDLVIGDLICVLDDGVTETQSNISLASKMGFYGMSAKEQYSALLEQNTIWAPGLFYKKSFLDKLGGYDEKYELIEDYPMWLKITSEGIKIHHFDKCVVKYRQSMTSVANPEKNNCIYNERVTKSSKDIFYDLRFKALIKEKKLRIVLRNVRRYLVRDIVIAFGNSRNNIACRILRKFE